MKYKNYLVDVLDYCDNYGGDLFHAFISDTPYNLGSITKRFGKKGSAAAKSDGKTGVYARASRGFMNQEWDSDVAFDPNTWKKVSKVLHPGALGILYGGARTYHRLTIALEDAGFLIYPQIFGWLYSSGFAKGANLSKNIDRPKGHFTKSPDYQPISDDAKLWSEHRYGAAILKPAVEPIIVVQKLYKGSAVQNILNTGAGTAWIEGTRNQRGNWIANTVIVHMPGCELLGHSEDSYTINTFDKGAKLWGKAKGEDFTGREIKGRRPVWKCVDGCNAKILAKTGGRSKSGVFEPHHKINSDWGYSGGERSEKPISTTYGDEGTVERYFNQVGWDYENVENLENIPNLFYQSKPGAKEKNAGLERKNPHATIKSIELNELLAKLLLPPAGIGERRIYNPFSGTGSEMVGAGKAGWDVIIGNELEKESWKTSEKRLSYWLGESGG